MNPVDINLDLISQFDPKTTQVARQKFRSIFPDLADHLIDDIYGFAYRRGQIDIQTRHLISLGILSAIGDCENQLDFHSKAALNLKIPESKIQEVFIQVAVFAGNARAINSAAIFYGILEASERSAK